MLSSLFLCVLFVVTLTQGQQQQQCTGNRQRIVLNFDDQESSTYGVFTGLMQPYNTFVFMRGLGGPGYNAVPLVNVSILSETGTQIAYAPGASSLPNVLVTLGNAMIIRQASIPTVGNPTFVLRSLSMFNVYIGGSMNMSITMSKNGTVVGTQYVSIPYKERTLVNITKLVNADQIVIGCANRTFGVTCDYAAYDDFEFCYSPL